jgi:hypothetical protein
MQKTGKKKQKNKIISNEKKRERKSRSLTEINHLRLETDDV